MVTHSIPAVNDTTQFEIKGWNGQGASIKGGGGVIKEQVNLV